ncbi:MAG: hypothetical protein LCH38_11620 [Proteobacteria bacterium]|nr:hypothetical protein [Pseudomonadota bacterium]
MSKIIRGAVAAALLAAVTACATAPAQEAAPQAPSRKLDAKTQLECGTKRACR